MRRLVFVLLILLGMACSRLHEIATEVRAPIPASPRPAAARVDFATQVQPIFEQRCQPCHFPGGVMYQKLPFDRAETIVGLGEKVFTRIKKDDERALIGKFLKYSTEYRVPSTESEVPSTTTNH